MLKELNRTGCPHTPKPPTIDELPIAEQPDMLTKAAMEFCLADAFHPGCEMTWPMRSSGMYMSPFRLKHAKKDPATDYNYYGATINSDTLTLAKGPLLGGQVAGGITRWMAVPWQTDTASCKDGYTSEYDPYLPTFWPARVPNNLLNEKRYKEVLNTDLAEETRIQAFAYRSEWLDDLPLDGGDSNYTNQINSMVTYFDKLAVVQKRTGILNDDNFPKEMQVGITPSKAQEKALREETLNDLNSIIKPYQLNDKMDKVLHNAIDKLSEKHLLNEQFLSNGDSLKETKETLLSLIKHEIITDFKKTPSIKRLLHLIAAKEHKIHKSKNLQHKTSKRKEVGVPEKMTRFSRYTPK